MSISGYRYLPVRTIVLLLPIENGKRFKQKEKQKRIEENVRRALKSDENYFNLALVSTHFKIFGIQNLNCYFV